KRFCRSAVVSISFHSTGLDSFQRGVSGEWNGMKNERYLNPWERPLGAAGEVPGCFRTTGNVPDVRKRPILASKSLLPSWGSLPLFDQFGGGWGWGGDIIELPNLLQRSTRTCFTPLLGLGQIGHEFGIRPERTDFLIALVRRHQRKTDFASPGQKNHIPVGRLLEESLQGKA